MTSNSELLTGKNAIITGCNRGIGKSMLESFAANGANVFACVRKKNAGFSKYIKLLSEKYSVSIMPVYFDASKIDEIKSAVKQISASKRTIDVLINNAGVGYNALFQMSSQDKLKEIFDINFIAPFILTQYISKLMVKQRSGSIINVASIAGVQGIRGRSVYGSSKAALINMTKVIASELGVFGIRANAIAPGLIDTEMIKGIQKTEINEIIENTSLKRIGKPSDVANIAVFLASDMASFVTGQVFRIDGGVN